MTKKKKIIIGLCALVIVIGAIIGGHVLAKYQTQVNGSGAADVAKWVFKVNGSRPTMQTIALNKNYNPDTLTNGRIAPGTEGAFDITINAIGSEVGIDYFVEFSNEQNKPQNLKFRYEGEEFATLEELASKLTGTIDANAEYKIKNLSIEWFWDYESGDDEADTQIGKDDLNYTFDVIVTGTQVTPQA